ncbi:MAG: gfo/Idh/MocA family oxidoreductase [Chloroflexi bacterium]|nr:MAG: gfo/Idh/MocA family oxidoreductase [Chloroflexota bacterium]
MGQIRAAIVGCGRISDLHVLGYRDRQDACLAGVYDQDQKAARFKAEAWGVPMVYSSYEALLADPEIDLVELLVPHHLHCGMTVEACRAGKHVSVQKPMALSAQEADRMIEASRQAGVLLRVYENFVFYEPAVRAKQMIEAGEIGEPQMIRMHVSTGSRGKSWKVPLKAWLWRLQPQKCGGGPLVFDHGYHLFSLAHYLMGEVEKVYAWIDRTQVAPFVYTDAPATIMFKFIASRRYGVFDIEHTPKTVIESSYYADDDRVEIVGEKGILFINRYTAKTIDLPELMLFRDGKTTSIPVDGVEWHDSFIAATQHMIDVLHNGGQPRLDGITGKKVLQFTLAALESSRSGKEVYPNMV